MFDNHRFSFLGRIIHPLLIIIHHLLHVIRPPNAKVHRRNGGALFRPFHQARRPHVIPPRNAEQFNDRKDPWQKERKEERKKKQRLEKKRKIPTKSLHISSMSSLHLSHCTDARILYKNRSTTYKSPPAGRMGAGARVIRSRIIVGPLESAPEAAISHIDLCEQKGSLMLR